MVIASSLNKLNRYLDTRIKATLCLAMVSAGSGCPVAAAGLSLSNIPLLVARHADPNVLLDLSVEGPTGGAAYNDQTSSTCSSGRLSTTLAGDSFAVSYGTCYSATTEYIGYFRPDRCYTYSASGRFEQAATTTDHTCSGYWSGNMLNWATMTAVDEFVRAMTGGYRETDSTTETVIQRARKVNSDGWFPYKLIRSSTNVDPATVAPSSLSPVASGLLVIYNTDYGFKIGSSAWGAKSSTTEYNVKVKVCANATDAEDNCVAYGSGTSTYYKPEGLIQQYANSMRFAVTSYSLDGSQTRDGGVLRENMKYVGPTRPTTAGSIEANPTKEYGNDGILINNPDNVSGGLNSGVINYINQFSYSALGYKSYDPIAELYYEGLRYFKHLGRTPEYADGLTTDQMGGFQVLTTWDDPILYSCQKNFIIGINDANPWLDKRLPGTYFTSATITGAGGTTYTLTGNDYGEPSNPDASINVRTLTNTVGSYEGLNGTTWTGTGTWTSGSVSGVNDSVGGGVGTFSDSCSDKTVANLGEVMGTCPSTNKQNSYYIAGLAYYGNTYDVRTDLAGKQTISTFLIDTQEYKDNPLDGNKNMLWLAGKYGGFVDKNGNDRPDLVSEWDVDGDGVPDNYVLATSANKIKDGLIRAFQNVYKRNAAAGAVALNTSSLQLSSKVYQASFDSADWSGEVSAYPISSSGTITTTPDWSAAATIDAQNYATDRRLLTYRKATKTAIPFRWPSNAASPTSTELESWQITALNTNPGGGASDTLGSARLNYLRGLNTGTTVSTFRERKHVLGDIIDSAPAYVAIPNSGYPDFWGTGATESASANAYSTFVTGNASRSAAIYVGANDGMLHALRASDGKELYAYIPSKVFKNLNKLTNPNYSHTYFVNGSPVVRDAFFGGAWHTVLVGNLRGGGQGIYALDVTSVPASTDSETTVAGKLLWEFNDDYDDSSSAAVEGQDLGYTFSDPSIVRLHNGVWAAVFGNGYNNTEADGSASTSGNAVLYIVNLQTGALIAKLDTKTGTSADPTAASRPNGLSSPAPVDANRDRITDYIYAGDLFGNMWKFDVTSSSPADWKIAYGTTASPTPLFTAKSSSGINQPITTRPRVGFHPSIAGSFMVYFGTGKYLETTDNATSGEPTQTFYGIWDKNESSFTSFTRSNLLQQSILKEVTQTFGASSASYTVRATSNNSIDWTGTSAKLGWYMDLVNIGVSPQDNKAEKVVVDSVLRAGRIIFATLVPSSDPCDYGGTSWLMELDAASGSRLNYTTFDLDGDGGFSSTDNLSTSLSSGTTETVTVSGKRSTVGVTGKPTIVSSGDKNESINIQSATGTSTCSSGISCSTTQTREQDNFYIGRSSWRELQTQ